MKKISVIVVTWNSQEYIANCLDAINRETEGFAREIFVVDNASVDRTIEKVQTKFPDAILERNQKNVGFAAANNQAIAKSTGDYVLLINPDTAMLPGALAKMAAALEKNSEIGAVGPMILNDDGSIQYTCARRLPTLLTEIWWLTGLDQRFQHSRIFGRYLMSDWDHRDSRFVGQISGACMLIRRETLQRCGPLDARFFFMYEDVEFCRRVSLQGYKIYYLADAVIKHSEGRSRMIDPETQYRTTFVSYLSMMQYYELTRGRAYTLLVRTVMGTIRAFLLVKQLVRCLLANPIKRPQERKKLKMYGAILTLLLTGRFNAKSA